MEDGASKIGVRVSTIIALGIAQLHLCMESINMENRAYLWFSTALLVLLGVSIALTGSAAAQSTGFVDVEADNLAGNGTPDDPYVITNASELQAMEDDLHAHYELGSDVNASNTAQWNDGRGFDPVGPGYDTAFHGTFDGTGHIIKGLTVDRSDDTRVGLFGVVEEGGRIRDLSVVSIDINGDFYSGGIVGSNDGTVISSSVTGTVAGSNNVGGLAGSNAGFLNTSHTNVSVTGGAQVGGLVGANFDHVVYKSYAMGPVDGSSRVGGLVGSNYRTITSSYATGPVTGDSKIGGLVGYNENDGDKTIITTSYATGTVRGTNAVGGLVGDNNASVSDSYWDTEATGQSTSPGGAVGLTTAKMTGTTARNSMSALDFEATWDVVTSPDGYPTLVRQDEPTDTPPEDSPEVPSGLNGEITTEQYTAVLDGDKELTAGGISAAVNQWATMGVVNGVDIGAKELSALINYWAV